MESQTIIHCYVAVSEEYGRRYYFNRMPEGMTALPDTKHFFHDESVEQILSKEDKDTLTDILCHAIVQKTECIREIRNDYPFGLYELEKNSFYIKFDLKVGVECKVFETPSPKPKYIEVSSENVEKFLDELREKKRSDLEELERKFLYYFKGEQA